MRRALLFAALLSVLLGRALLSPPNRAPAGSKASAGPRSLYTFSAGAPSGVRAYLRVESSQPVFNVLYRYGRVDAAPNGAYGPNATAPASHWYVEYQRAGATDVISGVLRGDRGLVGEGLRIFHFGLAREAPDGSFPGSVWPFHDPAMFLAEAAPALLVLKYSSMAESFQAELGWQTSRMWRAARHLARLAGAPGRVDDPTKNHRFFEAAMALGATGVLAGDKGLQRKSAVYAREGIRMQQPDGIMPEDGGYDSGYQALGMVHAARYLELLAPGALRQSLFTALRRGEAWEISRVRSDGTVDQRGDTRTSGCRERDPAGRCKTTFYAPIFDALARWSVIAGDTRYERVAYRVWLQNWQRVPGDVLPQPGLWAEPDPVQRGQWLTVHGAGFQPLEIVRVYFDGHPVQTLACDQIGSFGAHSPQPNAHFPLPGAAPGRHTITARGSLGTVRRAEVTVTG